MVLEWIREGNAYYPDSRYTKVNPNVPDHPQLSAEQARGFCIIAFPLGRLPGSAGARVGTEEGQLLPGTYKYYDTDSGDRVSGRLCGLSVNKNSSDESEIDLAYGEPFEFTIHTYHGTVYLWGCKGFLYRIGD